MAFLLPFVPALIGGAVALNSANQQKDAAKTAQTAQTAAQQQQLAAQQTALDRITNLQNPYVQGGYNALDQLAREYGLGTAGTSQPVTNAYGAPPPQAGGTPTRITAGGGASGPQVAGPSTAKSTGVGIDPASAGPALGTPAAPPTATGGPDWNAYLQANPDVAQYAQQAVQSGQIGPGKQWATPADWAAFQYQNTGQSEGRAPPPNLPLNQSPAQTDPGANPGQPPQDLGTASPVVPTYTDPTFGASPDASAYLDPSKFEASPDYAWRLAQGQRNLNANFGAKGLLQSGSAIQGALDYGQNQASQEFQNWWNRQQQLYSDKAAQYNTDKTTDYNIYSTDRGYGTDLALNNRNFANSVQNTRIANLFSLVNAGTGAAASVGNANTNYANNTSNVYGSQAQAAADAAAANASANSQLGGALGGIGTNLINGYSIGNSTPLPTQTVNMNPLALAPGQNPYMGPAPNGTLPNSFVSY